MLSKISVISSCCALSACGASVVLSSDGGSGGAVQHLVADFPLAAVTQLAVALHHFEHNHSVDDRVATVGFVRETLSGKDAGADLAGLPVCDGVSVRHPRSRQDRSIDRAVGRPWNQCLAAS